MVSFGPSRAWEWNCRLFLDVPAEDDVPGSPEASTATSTPPATEPVAPSSPAELFFLRSRPDIPLGEPCIRSSLSFLPCSVSSPSRVPTGFVAVSLSVVVTIQGSESWMFRFS